MASNRRFITPEEAISLLPDKEDLHTFRNPETGVLIGAPMYKIRAIELLKEYPDKIEITGAAGRAMEHGITLEYDGFLFIETDEEKLNAFDPIEEAPK